MFKKKKLKKKKKINKILNYISMFGIFIIFVLSLIIAKKIVNGDFDFYTNIEKINKTKLSSDDIKKIELLVKKRELEKKEIEKKKSELKLKKELNEKKKNILIIGRGGYGNDAPELTDSLILLSYYKEKKHISMLSIPRDLYVEYGDKNKFGKNITGKINGLYVHYLAKFQDKEKAIIKLEEKIEEITGEEIDFYVNLDFNGFIKLINSVDGVTVNVKKNLYDNKYPDNNHGFQIFSLSKGIQKLYGESALKYVRTRKNTGGDFGRSERQQQVIKSIKEKVLSTKYLTNPSKIKDLYNIFDKYVGTDIGIIDFTSLVGSIKLQNNLKFYSSTLNTSCIKKDECKKGGFLFYPQRKFFGGQSVVLSGNSTYKYLSNYGKIKKYSEIIYNSPSLFKENYKISIFSKIEDKENALLLQQELKKYGLKINVLEKIGFIPEFKSGKNNIYKNKITLEEYNKLKNKSNFNSNKISKNITNGINEESNNIKTKLIINSVDINSNTIKFLKKYLNIENNNIFINIDGPKYARDKNTKIEIIYKNIF